ncbi:MAG: ABC transporter ATP-binding protein [Candidatus Heimdallarchaeota archaeon]|nr:MAG: ABC transporter ATP-binding protein [Candidatus Heimdallarchaeota archaeon]
MSTTSTDGTILEMKGLKTQFFTEDGVVKAVDGVDLKIKRKEVLGLVGESGCGKTMTSLSILRLIPDPPGKIVEGEVFFNGKDLLKLTEDEIRSIRGNEISMIFQDPMTSLNPVFTVENQILENIKLHQNLDDKEALESGIQMLDLVGIPEASKRIHDYPHLFSGGMRQRVMIAMALSCQPDLLIADEPTTALDVTIQAQVLELMKNLQEELNMAILYITHNLGVIAEISDNVAVMYAGNIVEYAAVEPLFGSPSHPYTQALLGSIPRMDKKLDRLSVIKGTVPNLITPPTGCRFHPRCPYATEVCKEQKPPYIDVEPNHKVYCHYAGQLE